MDALLGVLLVMAVVSAQGHEVLGIMFPPVWLMVAVVVLMFLVWAYFTLMIVRRRKNTD